MTSHGRCWPKAIVVEELPNKCWSREKSGLTDVAWISFPEGHSKVVFA